jgi:hypothetical protein
VSTHTRRGAVVECAPIVITALPGGVVAKFFYALTRDTYAIATAKIAVLAIVDAVRAVIRGANILSARDAVVTVLVGPALRLFADALHADAGNTVKFAGRSVQRIKVTSPVAVVAPLPRAWIAVIAVNAFAKVLSTHPLDADVT